MSFRRFPLFSFFAGVVILTYISVPLIKSQLNYYLNDTRDFLNPQNPSLQQTPTDYTVVNNWFDLSNFTQSPLKQDHPSHFSLSIPSVNLEDVKVEVYGNDLKKNAIHFPGTALPGEYGNPVVFGHSTLNQLYKVGSPLSIFNPLPKVKIGDTISVTYNNVVYTYSVRKIQEVKPNQVEVLRQKYDRKELTLITCVPLGTYLRRLVIVAELIKSGA